MSMWWIHVCMDSCMHGFMYGMHCRRLLSQPAAGAMKRMTLLLTRLRMGLFSSAQTKDKSSCIHAMHTSRVASTCQTHIRLQSAGNTHVRKRSHYIPECRFDAYLAPAYRYLDGQGTLMTAGCG